MFELHYTGCGYPTMAEIEADAKARGFTHSFWGSDTPCGRKGLYNGDTVVVYNSTEGMDEGMKEDAERFGKEIVIDD